MLFGNERVQNIICNKAYEIASEIDGKLVFGAMVGSISQGVHTVDSDYDTRFLYVRGDFPEKILQPSLIKENDIVKRYYPEKGLFYDKIPLWELSSFLQFLVTPSIDGKFSVGLHHNIAWTFLSPFVWDPYGLVNKLSPMICQICNAKFEVQYHISKIKQFFSQDEDIMIKNYLYATLAAASIFYIDKMSTFAPIHIDSLMGVEERGDIRQTVYELINKMRKESEAFVQKSDGFVLQGSHYHITTKHDPKLDDYIMQAWQLGERLEEQLCGGDADAVNVNLLNQMYTIIARSMQEQIIQGLF